MAQVKALIGNIKGQPGKDGSENQIYSYDETPIGTWANGKPLYRKIIKASVNQGKQDVYDVSDMNLDEVIDIRGAISQSVGSFVPIPYYTNSNDFTVVYYPKSSNYIKVNTSTNGIVNIILEYTKTTDTATT